MRLTLTKGFAVFDPGLRMCSRDRRGLCYTVGAYSGARCSQIRRLFIAAWLARVWEKRDC